MAKPKQYKPKKSSDVISQPNSDNPFSKAVIASVEIKDALKPGLSALRSHSKSVKAADPSLLSGSVDIDAAVKHVYPTAPRWDYVVGYDNDAFFVEVHPAGTSNVDEMVKKVNWLKSWLSVSAPELKALHKHDVYYWLPSGGESILKGSVQERRIAASHLQIIKVLNLPR